MTAQTTTTVDGSQLDASPDDDAGDGRAVGVTLEEVKRGKAVVARTQAGSREDTSRAS